MPRKSNKTAHVLNLLAGQDAADETENEKAEEAGGGAARPAAQPSTPSASPPQPQAAPAQPDMPSNISIVDHGAGYDPVAERIRDELLKSLDEGAEEATTGAGAVGGAAASEGVTPMAVAAEGTVPRAEAVEGAGPRAEAAAVPDTPSVPEPAPAVSSQAAEGPSQTVEASPQTVAPQAEVSQVAVMPSQATVPQTVGGTTQAAAPSPEPAAPAAPETSSPKETEEVIELAVEEPPVKEEAPAQPEPDYVILNVMQEVVKDKIIYFMKQFDVCTCDRCRADTIALTLSGLPARYKVVDKAAVAPLVSFYASRLISQVTVEALKACTEVRENPRH